MSFDITPQRSIRFGGSGLKPVLSPYVAGLLTLSLDRKRRRRDVYVTDINSNESSLQLEGTKKLARLLEADPRIGDLRPKDIRVLIGFLKHRENPKLQFYALYALTNVDANAGELIKTEALPVLVQLMKSKSMHTKMQVLITLSRVAYDFPTSTKYLCENGALKALQNIVEEYKYNDIMLLNCSTFLAIVCRSIFYHYKPQPRETIARVHQIVNFLLQRGLWYEELQSHVIAAVSFLSPSRFGRTACAIYLGLISDADPLISVSVLQVIVDIFACGSPDWITPQIMWMLEGRLLQRIYSLPHKYKIVRFQVCSILNQIVRLFGMRHGDFEIVENEKWPNFFSVIKDLATGQQIDFADPEDVFPITNSVSIGPFCNLRNCDGLFSELDLMVRTRRNRCEQVIAVRRLTAEIIAATAE